LRPLCSRVTIPIPPPSPRSLFWAPMLDPDHRRRELADERRAQRILLLGFARRVSRRGRTRPRGVLARSRLRPHPGMGNPGVPGEASGTAAGQAAPRASSVEGAGDSPRAADRAPGPPRGDAQADRPERGRAGRDAAVQRDECRPPSSQFNAGRGSAPPWPCWTSPEIVQWRSAWTLHTSIKGILQRAHETLSNGPASPRAGGQAGQALGVVLRAGRVLSFLSPPCSRAACSNSSSTSRGASGAACSSRCSKSMASRPAPPPTREHEGLRSRVPGPGRRPRSHLRNLGCTASWQRCARRRAALGRGARMS